MTERKPRGMTFRSWIDQQIHDAQQRGVFDNLPGAGKPLDLKREAEGDFGQAWVRDYARREGVRPEEFLPTPLRLRKESELLADAVADMRTEQEVRAAVADLNRRIVEWRRIPDGPPIHVRLVNEGEMTARWRAAQADRSAEPAPPSPAATGLAPGSRARWRPWRRRRGQAPDAGRGI